MRAPLVVFLALLLAGCVEETPEGGTDSKVDTSGLSLDCVIYVCPADPSGHDAVLIRENVGLERLTDDEAAPGFISVDGDWIAWVTDSGTSFIKRYGYEGDIFAMHIPTRTIYAVSTDEGHAILPRVNDGRILYEYSSPEWQGMVLWNASTNTSIRLDPELGSNYRPEALDGDWVLFQVKVSSNKENEGVWAWNLQDDRRIQLYETKFKSINYQEGRSELYFDGDLLGGTAYIMIGHANASIEKLNSTIHRVNLETMEERVYHNDWPGAHGHLSVTSEYAVFQSLPDVVAMNLATGEFHELSPEDSECGNPNASGDWAVFDCTTGFHDQHHNVATNLATDQYLVYYNQSMLWSGDPTTDGTTMVLDARTNGPPFETHQRDLYASKLP